MLYYIQYITNCAHKASFTLRMRVHGYDYSHVTNVYYYRRDEWRQLQLSLSSLCRCIFDRFCVIQFDSELTPNEELLFKILKLSCQFPRGLKKGIFLSPEDSLTEALFIWSWRAPGHPPPEPTLPRVYMEKE